MITCKHVFIDKRITIYNEYYMYQKIITLANHKGGVGKSTSTASIGACMALMGKKVLLIDCPPSLGIVTTNAFLAADAILVPMTPELLPLKGMRMLDSFVTSLQKVKPSLRLNGVFTTRFNHRKLNKSVENAVRARYKDITLNTRIRENIALAESAGSGSSIFEYDPNSNGAKDYWALTEEILNL